MSHKRVRLGVLGSGCCSRCRPLTLATPAVSTKYCIRSREPPSHGRCHPIEVDQLGRSKRNQKGVGGRLCSPVMPPAPSDPLPILFLRPLPSSHTHKGFSSPRRCPRKRPFVVRRHALLLRRCIILRTSTSTGRHTRNLYPPKKGNQMYPYASARVPKRRPLQNARSLSVYPEAIFERAHQNATVSLTSCPCVALSLCRGRRGSRPSLPTTGPGVFLSFCLCFLSFFLPPTPSAPFSP